MLRKRIVFVGRPNVGKSTLFNRLAGKALAVVYDTPGVTRDWKEHHAILEGCHLILVDTPGFELEAAKNADHIVFVCDAKDGIIPADVMLMKKIRRLLTHKNFTLVLNKAEKTPEPWLIAEAHQLIGYQPVPISALHGQGIHDLTGVLIQDIAFHGDGEQSSREEMPQIVIVGQPNSGKSTLINTLLKQDRVRVGEQAGLTRDVIPVPVQLGDSMVMICDTPGLRRKSKVKEALEGLSWKETMRAIRFAHVVVLLMDATSPFEAQDRRLAQHIIDEGRAIVVAVNKWDLVKDKGATLKQIQDDLAVHLPMCHHVLAVSALKKQGIKALLDQVHASFAAWNRVIKTRALNRWLSETTVYHQPPRLPGGKILNFKYITQIKCRPPTFAIFTNVDLAKLNVTALRTVRHYERYLTNRLYKTFELFGTPARISLRFKI